MADENTNALFVTNGGRLSEQLVGPLHQTLYDPTDLRRLMLQVPYPGMGSLVSSITKLPAPTVASAASSETSGGWSNSAFTTSEAQMTLAMQGAKMWVGDLLVTSGINMAPEFQAPDIVLGGLMRGFGLRFTDMLCALFPSVSSSVGTTTVNLTVDDVYSGIYQLMLSNVPVDAGVAAVLHNRQMADFMESLRGEAGAMQFQAATAEMLSIRSPGTKGTWAGVEFVQSDSVNTANAGEDRAGCIFGIGAFKYQIGPIGALVGRQINPSDVVVNTPEMIIERIRSAANNQSDYYIKFLAAVAEIEDLRACQIVTDA